MATVLLFSAVDVLRADPSGLVEPDGAYGVGVRRFELIDHSRHGVVSADPTEPRVLPGYVWYPSNRATGPGRTSPGRAYFTPEEVADQGRAMARNFHYGEHDLDRLADVQTHSTEGAEPATGQTFPILIFNHGYECYPAQNTALLEQLASHGYVVFSIAHPHDAADIRLADGTLLKTDHPAGNDPEFASLKKILRSGPDHAARTSALKGYPRALARDRLGASFNAWRDDTLFTVRSIEERKLPKDLLPIVAAGDTQRFGFVGMSFGGATAASTCRLAAHCRVAINMDGGNDEPEMFNALVERPLLLLMSDWIQLPLPNRPNDPAFAANDYAYEPWARAGLDPDVVRLRLDGSRHMGFTDLIMLLDGAAHEDRFGTIAPQVAADAISAASLAFLDQYLKGGRREALLDVLRRTPALHIHSPTSVRRWANGEHD